MISGSGVFDTMSMSFLITGWAKIVLNSLIGRGWKMEKIKRCYLCKHCIGMVADWDCRKLMEKNAKTKMIVIHQQAEKCPDYEPRDK